MSLQYVYNHNGLATSVIIPINDWNQIKEKYPDVDQIEGDLPQWQKDVIDERMMLLKQHPNDVTTLEDFIKELDKLDEDL